MHAQHTFCKYSAHMHALICLQLINWQSDHGYNTSCAVIQCKLVLINELSLHELEFIFVLIECKH